VTAPRPGTWINGADAIAASLQVIDRLAGPEARRVIGSATVDMDRAERDLVASFGSSARIRSRHVPDDELLGARCRLVTSGSGEPEVLLLEPATEGRIAASLARFAEGPVAVYVIVPDAQFGDLVQSAGRAGLALSTEAPGPFGRQRLVAGGPPWGAHLCVAQSAGAATIEP
jgi:hypothetical protein